MQKIVGKDYFLCDRLRKIPELIKMQKYFTNIHSLNDGFGESLKFVLFSLFYAEYCGAEFHYTPFQKTLEHNYENDPYFLWKKEELMRFHRLFPPANTRFFSYGSLSKFDLIHFFELNAERIMTHSKIFAECKKVFYQDRSRPRSQPYAAIHIRRMNALDKSKSLKENIEGCDVPYDVYNEIGKKIMEMFPNMEIHVFSQGDSTYPFDFPVMWRLNESIETTFLEMAFADLLVVAPSAFSYTAGLYSNASEIWYIQSCFRPLSHWRPVLGYVSSRNKYTFFLNTAEGKKEIVFQPLENKFYTLEGKEIFF